MKKHLWLITLLLLLGAGADAWAQTRPGSRKAGARRRAAGPRGPGRPADAANDGAAVGQLKLKNPVIVYYEAPAPGTAVQQLIMSEEHLGLLKTLDLEHLMARREVFVDGLGNLALPGRDAGKFRLLGTSAVAEAARRPAGDGRSFYSRLHLPASGVLYVVREPAENYRHFVKGPVQKGALLDFQNNGLPGLDSVQAVYTLRKMHPAERGAGSGQIVR